MIRRFSIGMFALPAIAQAPLCGSVVRASAHGGSGSERSLSTASRSGGSTADLSSAQPAEIGFDEALNVEAGSICFSSEGDHPWYVNDDGFRTFAVSGNTGIASSVSVLEADVNALEGDVVSFEFIAWGEGKSTIYDECSFSADGVVRLSYGAYAHDWEPFSVPLEPGGHTLTWAYRKDESFDPAGDFFAVDNAC